MTYPGTARYAIPIAPPGVALVQELLNTVPVGSPPISSDLLADPGSAQHWADEVRGPTGAAPGSISQREVGRLRDLRTALRGAIHDRDGRPDDPAAFRAQVPLVLTRDGVVSPDGEDLPGAILLETYASQSRGDWARLKLCAKHECDLAFYDRTKNVSARFHTPSCANSVNLRNSRARRRESEGFEAPRSG